jgi:N utilization substance protein B
MKRSEARELVMQLLYQMSMQKDFSETIKNRFSAEYLPESKQSAYFEDTIATVLLNLEQIDSTIESGSDNWKINRIDQVDLAILRLAIAEVLFINEIPDSASINEAVELAKKYGGSNSSKFINGILGKISRGKNA